MDNSRIERLHYTVGSGSDSISYGDPPAISLVNELGSFELRNGFAEVRPAEHFGNEEEARRAIEPFFRDWEIATDLTSNPGEIRFTFVRSEISGGQPGVKAIVAAARGRGTLDVKLEKVSHKYPAPPPSFRTTTDVEIVHRRWLAYTNGREPLQSMAFFVLTVMQKLAGGRREAGKVFGIDGEVLSEVGRLSSTKGDALTVRKAGGNLDFVALSDSEKRWLERAIRRLIFRLGEHAGGAPLLRITCDSLAQ